MKQRRINATLKRALPPIAALALTTLLILTALPQVGTAAPRLERQPLESLSALNTAEATERGVSLSAFSAPSAASVVQLPGTTTCASAALHSSPVMFIENVGQFPEEVRFQVWGGLGTMWLAEDAIWITIVERSQTDPLERFDVEREDEPIRGVNLKLSFPGANPHPRIEPFDRLDTVVSYFIGSNPDQWHPAVPVWGRVRYVDIYPSVDLEVTSEEGRWLWRAVAKDGAVASSQIRLGIEGADVLTLKDSVLHLTTAIGEYALPFMQAVTIGGTPLDLAVAQPTLTNNEIHAPFAVPTSNPQSLFPQSTAQDNPDDLLYSTFLGKSGYEYGCDIAVDGTGNAYVIGFTESSDFPTTPGAFDTTHNGSKDAFVVKLSADGTGLTYATFLGGEGDEMAGRAIERAGSVYVTGHTSSSDFPITAGALDTSFNGIKDAFVVKVSDGGTALAYATFIGGSDSDGGSAIAVDSAGSAYVTGGTYSADFPTTAGAFDTASNGREDAFVVKVSADGTGMGYATFLGGSYWDSGHGVALDGAGSAYVTGETRSSDFPTTPGALDTTYNGSQDAFVMKVSADGMGLVYATFLGGNYGENGFAIALDGAGSTYVTGFTNSSDFPTTPGAFDTTHNGSKDAFVVKLSADGTGLVYSTFLGGSGWWDNGYGIVVDGTGSTYVTGTTNSSDFPTTPGAFDTSYYRHDEAFVAKLTADGTGLAYSTFLGGQCGDYGFAIALDSAGSAYVTGYTFSYDFPTTSSAFDTSYNDGGDAFVAKLAVGDGATCYDFNGDGQVDIDDIMRVASRWRTSCDSPDPDDNLDTPNYDPLYDIDDDCDIDIVDIMLVVVHWGETCG